MTYTNPKGSCFISYKRSRLSEINMLVASLRERGVPTWQDVNDLDESHTNTELRQVLQDPCTANAVMWLTPDVADSPVIQKIEAPLIMNRADKDDVFFVIPVAAGGADYEDAANAVGNELPLTKLDEWNIRKINSDPAHETDIQSISNRVLSRRFRSIIASLPADEPIHIGLYARQKPQINDDSALLIDWSDQFTNRHAKEWKTRLLPALADIVDTFHCYGEGRKIVASGLPTLCAAFALGRTLMAPQGIDATWLQYHRRTGTIDWNLNVAAEPVGLDITSRDKMLDANDLAVLISINASVENAWHATVDLTQFRAIINVRLESESNIDPVLTSGNAVYIANQITNAIKEAKGRFRPKGTIHYFMSVPTGLSFLLGQLSNALGPIQLYEHDETDSIGRYVAGPLLA